MALSDQLPKETWVIIDSDDDWEVLDNLIDGADDDEYHDSSDEQDEQDD
jgi:hypothetical protein